MNMDRKGIPVTAIAFVEDGRPFVGAAQLALRVSHLLAAALLARLLHGGLRGHLGGLELGHVGALGAQGGRVGIGLGAGDDGL
jgi:hypothetical protein